MRLLYLKDGIKRKAIRQIKEYPLKQFQSYQLWKKIVLNKLVEVKDKNLKLIWLDVCIFTMKTLQKLDWRPRYKNLTVDQTDLYFKYKSVIVTTSVEKGVELIQIFDHAVNQHNFARFLGLLSLKHDGQPFALYMDNLSVHKTKLVREVYEN